MYFSSSIVDLEFPPRTSRPLGGGEGGLQHVCIEYLQIYCYCLYFKVDHEDNVANGRSKSGRKLKLPDEFSSGEL